MSFLTPFFFVGLAAVLVPVLIHLVRRARAPRVEFPSLMFVRQVPQRTIRRRRLHNLLLLLLRCLALAALVLAFVRPYVSWGADENRARGRTVILLLDRSFSMRAGDGSKGRSRFAQAVEPGNTLLAERMADAVARRAQDLRTVPSAIKVERETNPFLRADAAAVRQSAAERLGREPASTVECFAEVRSWKNVFR